MDFTTGGALLGCGLILFSIAMATARAVDLLREIRTLLKDVKSNTEHNASCAGEILNLQQARHMDGR